MSAALESGLSKVQLGAAAAMVVLLLLCLCSRLCRGRSGKKSGGAAKKKAGLRV